MQRRQGGYYHLFDDDILLESDNAIRPTGIASAEAFGTAEFIVGIVIEPTGIASAEAFGTPIFTGVNVLIQPTGIASGEAFGTPVIREAILNSLGYEIMFYDHDGVRQRVLETWEFLQYTQRVNAPWNHNIRIQLSYENDLVDFLREDLSRDWIVEIYRTDEVTGIRTRVYEGFHLTTVDQAKKEGTLIFNLYGSGYTSLLGRRIVIPPANQEHSTKSGPAETVMKDFVDECAVNPVDSDRVIPGLSVEFDMAEGDTAEYSARYTELPTVINRLAEQGRVDYGVVRLDEEERGTFVFQVRPLWGEDRTVANTDNNPPTIFDIFYGNMEIPILSLNGSEEKNVVYIAGRAQGVNRRVEEYENAEGVAASPWNRKEDFVDARNEADSGLETQAQAQLNKQRFRNKLEFNIRQTRAMRWLRDWNLGDLITARYFTYNFDKKVVEVSVTVSAGAGGQSQEEVITAELEDIVT